MLVDSDLVLRKLSELDTFLAQLDEFRGPQPPRRDQLCQHLRSARSKRLAYSTLTSMWISLSRFCAITLATSSFFVMQFSRLFVRIYLGCNVDREWLPGGDRCV